MKALIIKGTYHKKGMISELVESFKAGLLKTNPSAQVNVIDLLDLDIKFCTGTCVCGKDDGKPIGDCVLKDAAAPVLQEMLACDILVMATPIYCLTQTALMQRFIERSLPLLKFSSRGPKPRNPVRKDKQGIVILSTGAPYPFNTIFGFTGHAQKVLSGFCRYSGCAKVTTLKAGGMEMNPKAKEHFLKLAYNSGASL